MLNGFNKTIIYLIFCISLITLSGCEMVFNGFFKNEPQRISGPIEIGPEWREITPPESLKSRNSIQYVSLKMPEAVWRNADWDDGDSKRQTLKFAGGQRGKIEAFIVDEKGQQYELQITGKGEGFDLGILRPARNFNEPPNIQPDFPASLGYVKIRIRSDVPLHLDRMEWHGYNPK